ncbi:MAG: prolipoprotein diacylglyceryl transferase [Bacteroidota bacterium]|nr:prolipoprotein diacylglyceryl transferase [Bacteroidota bacterium]
MYASIYHAVKDLFGLDLPFLKMIQSFGFFVALAFLVSAYLWTKELKRKELEGLLKAGTTRFLKGQKATPAELITSGLIGFLLGFKLVYIVFNFSAFTENTQGFLLSTDGNLIAGLTFAAFFAYLKFREKEKTKLEKPIWVEEPMHPHQHVGNLTLIAAFTGLLGAKLFHNFENWDHFTKDPVGALLSFDGLTMYGGLICASIACIWYGKKNNIPVPHLIDTAAPSLMIGYAIGRVGCHVSGDGDWGITSTSPKPAWMSWAPDWMWSYDYPNNVLSEGVPLAGCEGEKYCNHLVPPVFPTPFYEAVACLLLFFVIWYLRKKITIPGMLFSVYLILNGFERFFIEKIRVNNLIFVGNFSFTQAELIATLLLLAGIAGCFYFRRLERKKLNLI